ncbi:hypothetical protein [Rhodopirellula sp. MGV]|uniref:hypothetical protein n=1 Tax=Rhodopirellula sp. MGV TaxID=2023130 RepID=UPI000BDB92D6|nr:hypothetical protein [Rhodopirellula sp. MGV]OYP37002.1 hypothetical protein CGZ80_06510 [Rhodopirellula sp. MGV]
MTGGTEPMRVSKSRSKIYRDGRCVIVYRMDEGHYSEPVTLSRQEAIEVASEFRKNTCALPQRNINLAAANFVFNAVQQLGWLEGTGHDSSAGDLTQATSESDVADEEDTVVTADAESPDDAPQQLTQELPTRKYFPFIAAAIRPSIDSDRIGDLAFVLSGVAPARRVDPQSKRSDLTISDFVRQANHRISPTQELMRDHHYALSQYHHLDLNGFRARWTSVNEKLGKQEATDLLKLVRKLRKLEIGDDGAAFKDVQLQPLLESIYDKSIELMHHQFRTARRKLEEAHTTVVKKPAPNAIQQFLQRFQRGTAKSSTPKPIELSEIEQQITRDYLDVAIKLGQIVRAFP